MSEIYKTIADGYEQLAAAFRSLASATEDPKRKRMRRLRLKPFRSLSPRKRLLSRI